MLSIGIEDYHDAELRQHGALANAQAVLDSLIAVNDGFYLERSRLLLGPAATAPALRAAMQATAAGMRPGDLFVLYFRGLSSPRFLVLADTARLPAAPSAAGASAPPELEARVLRADSLGRWLAALPTRQQLVIIDAPQGAAFFQGVQARLTTPAGARRASRDILAIASPSWPVPAVDAQGSPHTALGLGLLRALSAERRQAPIRLGSALATRLLESLDDPVMIYEAGADLVLGASRQPLARANANALRDSLPWTSNCGGPLPVLPLQDVRNTITLVGSAAGLPAGARLFVNGRRARFLGEQFEVELPPGALQDSLRLRVLLPDGCRAELLRPPLPSRSR